MSSDKIAQVALDAFDLVVNGGEHFRSRPGQRLMAQQVAQTFSQAELGKNSDSLLPSSAHIAVIQAGTGVGKSLAYCAPAIAVALARETRVLISTATVALQEQLVTKDLPALAKRMPTAFKFALAKGRGRYICQLKLDRLTTPGTHLQDSLYEDDEAESAAIPSPHTNKTNQAFYKKISESLSKASWDGDRDSLDNPPEPAVWLSVAADSNTCTAKYCPSFNQCAYFEKRKELIGANVIVINHDLLLASLGTRNLPELHNCLLILDEAHHLPNVALGQFAHSTDLTRIGWIDTLTNRARRIGALMEISAAADLPRLGNQLKEQMHEIGRIAVALYGAQLTDPPATNQAINQAINQVRLAHGILPESLQEPLAVAEVTTEIFLKTLQEIAKALRTDMRNKPEEARRLATLYAQLGMLSPKLEEVATTLQLLSQSSETSTVPNTKWFTSTEIDHAMVIKVHASPTLPGSTLRTHLWSATRAVVLTSATLKSCGEFDFFLKETGLDKEQNVVTLEVESPFDYAKQGQFITIETHADPKNSLTFTPEMVQALIDDIAQIEHGALVLFTSREQMRQAVAALPQNLQNFVLVQGQLPRITLLEKHRNQVAQDLPSIIFGMQSFGEGLDLPGTLCEAVFITKLPFAPPDDPVSETRAEWLRSVGRDPFNELVVPATAIRLAQWSGRAIRTESDTSRVFCYDRRLTNTRYGLRLLQGLPAFTMVQRKLNANKVAVI